jgi:hypothetical protein
VSQEHSVLQFAVATSRSALECAAAQLSSPASREWGATPSICRSDNRGAGINGNEVGSYH